MKNSLGKRKGLSGFFLAFLIVALLFLAVGLGTLGSLTSAGEAFELRSKLDSDTETPSVTFRLSNLTETDSDGHSTTTNLRLAGVAINIAAIYGEPDEYATLRIERSTSGTIFSTPLDGVIENHTMPEPVLGEDGKPVKDVPTPDATEAFFRFVEPFHFPEAGWNVTTYSFMRLSLYGTNPNVLINEIVFIGEKLDASGDGTGEMCTVPAAVYAATPYDGESAAAAAVRAAALIDAQALPAQSQSTFWLFSEAEKATLKTIAEMRIGNTYAADAQGNALDTYEIEGTYGALGIDILYVGTRMFGMSPFGLRFFSMLASFGALIVLAKLCVRLTRSEKAGFVFSLLYALSCLTLGYGHLGTPAMLGVFFFACSLDLVHAFYAGGIRGKGFLGALPLIFAGLLGGAAICIHAAFIIPVAGVVGLFIAGMVRQQQVKRYRIQKILAEENSSETPEEGETREQRAAKTAAEFRFKNRMAPIVFAVSLVLGTFLLALVGMLPPAYFAYLKAYDTPVSSAVTMNVFSLAWRSFAGGFSGTNAYTMPAWSVFTELFRGTGNMYALTALTVNPVVLVAGGAGLLYALVRLVAALFAKEHGKAWRAEMRRDVIVLSLFVLALVSAFAAANAAVFVLLMYLTAMLAGALLFGGTFEKGAGKAVRVVNIVGAVLLALSFAALAVAVFSVPLPETFWTAVLG